MNKFIKLAISLALLVFLFNWLETGVVLESLKLLSLPTLFLLIVGYALGQIVSTYKWQLILRHTKIIKDFLRVLTAYFTGMFINSFGLGIVGGDLGRALIVANKSERVPAIATVVVDRIHGLLVLGLIGLIASLFVVGKVSSLVSVASLAFTLLAVLIWLLKPSVFYGLIPTRPKFFAKLRQALDYVPRDFLVLQKITIVSVVFHLLQIFLQYLLASSLGLSIPFLVLLATIPFINILTSLPISWNGLGVREVAYIYFLGSYINNEQATAFGLVWLVVVTANSAIGGLVALLTGQKDVLSDA